MKFIFFILLLFFNSLGFTYEITIVAKVNSNIITNIDLNNRLRLVLDLSNLPDEEDIKEKLTPRVLDSLIDDSLKRQEANKLGIYVTNQEVVAHLNRLEKRFKVKENTLLEKYKEKNIPEITVVNQIRSQLLWEKLLYNVVIKGITISEKKISETFDLIIEKSGEIEYNISEIFISLDNNAAEQTIKSIYSKLETKNFLLLAEQFSDGIVYSGDLKKNWTRESFLEKNIKLAVSNLEVGQISKPVKSASGYHILLLNDKRKTKKINKDETVYDLSQILIKLNDGDIKSQEQYYKGFLKTIKNTIKGCDDLINLIGEIPEGYGGSLGRVESKNIENKFLSSLINLPVGVLSDPIITSDGVHGLMICSPVIQNSFEQFKQSIEANLRKNKIDSAAQSLLSRIRKKALIEINKR